MIIEKTADGYDTIYLPQMDEHYHSVKGAYNESRHIFIDMGFRHCTSRHPRIVEFGFGTGLNALLTAEEADRTMRDTTYIALELHPLPADIITSLNYAGHDDTRRKELFDSMHRAEWGRATALAPHFTLEKVLCDFTQASTWQDKAPFDIVYFDAFAPEKQQGIWTAQLFADIAASMAKGGTLVTYCSKGAVRRCLQSVGLDVERLPGPPGGKREILRATRH